MKLKVVVTPVARQQIRDLKAWWRRNRPKAPTLLREELRRVFDLIARQPEIGHRVEEPGVEGLRCHPVRRTPYLVYYQPNVEERKVQVLAVWSGMREHGPPV